MRSSQFWKRLLTTLALLSVTLLAVGVPFCVVLFCYANILAQALLVGFAQALNADLALLVCAIIVGVLCMIHTALTMPLHGIPMLLFGAPLLFADWLQGLFND